MGFPAVEMDEEEGEQFHIFDFDFHSVDLAIGRLSFGLRWIQRIRQEFSINIHVGG
jgi:hypothetical protein